MSPVSHGDAICTLLEQLIDLEPAQRQAHLREHYAHDPAFRRRVAACLWAADSSSAGLTQDLVAPLVAWAETQQQPAVLPCEIGEFRIIRLLGEGGMGRVFLAEQSEPHRQVALKLIKSDWLGGRMNERFTKERLVLARLNLDYIVPIFSVGQDAHGQPYFTMPLIEGASLLDYCQSRSLELNERLALFVKVCLGVHHAHSRGVVHRDLKPTNILVEEQDGLAMPRIIDFGIAKLKATEAGEELWQTRESAGFPMGTLAYLSPEQVARRPDQIDDRSDVYALGLILYELVADSFPFDIQAMAAMSWEDLFGFIRRQLPKRPSRRSRGLVSDLSRGRKAELDAIVLKALQKDKRQRYGSALDLVEDLRRYLRGEPVLAAATTTWYRVTHWVRRHRLAVAVSTIVSLSLALGLAFSTWSFLKERKQVRRTQATLQILEGLLNSTQPHLQGTQVTLATLLDEFSVNLSRQLAGQPWLAQDVYRIFGNAYAGLGKYAKAEHAYAESVVILEGLRGSQHEDTLTLAVKRAQMVQKQGRYQEAEALVQPLLEAGEQHFSADHEVNLTARQTLGELAGELGRSEEERRMLRDVWLRRKTLHGLAEPRTQSAQQAYALSLLGAGECAVAEPIQQELLDICLAQLGERHASTMANRSALVSIYRCLGRLKDAESLAKQNLVVQEQWLGKEHPDTLSAKNSFLLILGSQGRYEEMEPVMAELCDQLARVHGETHRHTMLTRHNYAVLLRQMGKIGQARAMLTDVMAQAELIFEETHPDRLLFRATDALLLQSEGKPREWVARTRENLALCLQSMGPKHSRTLAAANELAYALRTTGQPDEAREILRRYLEQIRGMGLHAEQHAMEQNLKRAEKALRAAN